MNSLGLLPGQTRHCTFVATTSGGWREDYFGGAGYGFPVATVSIRRGTETTGYTTAPGVSCGSGVIRDGDTVTVELHMSSGEINVFTRVGAGEGWACRPAE